MSDGCRRPWQVVLSNGLGKFFNRSSRQGLNRSLVATTELVAEEQFVDVRVGWLVRGTAGPDGILMSQQSCAGGDHCRLDGDLELVSALFDGDGQDANPDEVDDRGAADGARCGLVIDVQAADAGLADQLLEFGLNLQNAHDKNVLVRCAQ